MGRQGKFGGICNRNGCLSKDMVQFWNKSTEKYYCFNCCLAINSANNEALCVQHMYDREDLGPKFSERVLRAISQNGCYLDLLNPNGTRAVQLDTPETSSDSWWDHQIKVRTWFQNHLSAVEEKNRSLVNQIIKNLETASTHYARDLVNETLALAKKL